MPKPQTILEEVAAEIRRAKTKHPKAGNQDLFRMLAIVGEEKGECDKAALEHTEAIARGDMATARDRARDLRKELIQLAATAVQFVELYDANQLAVYGDQIPESQS